VSGRRRVLIVDDDEAIRTLLRLTLSTDDYEVFEAVDGEDGLRMLGEVVPDLILLDWKMPGRHGSLVLDEVKATQPTLPVIVLTSEMQEHHRRLAESLLVDAFLTKPFSPIELLDTIERLLGERPLEQPT
jgi:two-component system, OmpR family, phosphate regulon response regulator PhoB